MTAIGRTYTFADSFPVLGGQIETEISSIVDTWNNHDAGLSAFTNVIVKGVNPWADVKAQGAKGDGSTDDAAAIQAAIDKFSSTGGTVYFPPGTYIIGTSIKVRDDVMLLGSGFASIIKIKNSSNIDLLTNLNYGSSGGGNRVRLIGLTFDGNKANNASNGSMVLFGVNDGVIMGCRFLGGNGTSCLLRQSNYWRIVNNLVNASNTDGITVYDNSNYNYIGGNIIRSNSGHGILVFGPEVAGQSRSAANIVEANQCISNSLSGIRVENGTDETIVNANYCASNGNLGIQVYAATLSGTAYPHKNLIISNNICKDNASDSGIKVFDDSSVGIGALNVLITGNRCFDDSSSQNYGINLQNNTDSAFVHGNDVRGNVSAGILLGGGVNSNGRIWDNPGYVTKATGATSVADGNTINHGLALTPTVVLVSTTVSGEGASVTAKGSTNFTVAIKKYATGAAGTTQTIYWQASAE